MANIDNNGGVAGENAAILPPDGNDAYPAHTVRLIDYHAEDPAAWFAYIESAFEVARIRSSKAKFNHALQKLPLSLFPTIRDIQANAATLADPYEDLKTRLTNSFGLSKAQRIDAFLDHPGLGDMKPSVLLDRIWALMPETKEEIAFALFFRRLPPYIRDVVSGGKTESRAELGATCNKIWEQRGGAAAASAAMAAAVRHTPPGGRDRRAQSPGRKSGGGGSGNKPSRHRSPTPGGGPKEYPDAAGNCYFHATWGVDARKCRKPCLFQENEMAGGGN